MPFFPIWNFRAIAIYLAGEGEKERRSAAPFFARLFDPRGGIRFTLRSHGRGLPGTCRQSDSPAKEGLPLFAVALASQLNAADAFEILDLHRLPPLLLPDRRLTTPFA